jgi:glutathione S-transferase
MDWQATRLTNSCRQAFMALVRRDPKFMDSREIDQSIKRWNQYMPVLGDADPVGC